MNMMNKIIADSEFDTSARYAQCIEVSKRINWDIDMDVIRGREFDVSEKFLPDALSKVEEIKSLNDDEKRFLSQIQGRTYANMFGLVERFINTKVLEIGQDYSFGDQVALEALIRFSQEEIKHQQLFRRIDKMCEAVMPEGYNFLPQPNDVAHAVLSKSTWAVLALTLDIELFTQTHYRDSIDPTENLSLLWKDVFKYHWREESQHAILDELEWVRHDAMVSEEERDQGVDEFIELVAAVDGILQVQAKADVDYFVKACWRIVEAEEAADIEKTVLSAYRYQYIFSGAAHPHFGKVLGSMITPAQANRIHSALNTIQ